MATFELPALYADTVTAAVATSRPVLANRDPAPGESGVPLDSTVALDIIDPGPTASTGRRPRSGWRVRSPSTERRAGASARLRWPGSAGHGVSRYPSHRPGSVERLRERGAGDSPSGLPDHRRPAYARPDLRVHRRGQDGTWPRGRPSHGPTRGAPRLRRGCAGHRPDELRIQGSRGAGCAGDAERCLGQRGCGHRLARHRDDAGCALPGRRERRHRPLRQPHPPAGRHRLVRRLSRAASSRTALRPVVDAAPAQPARGRHRGPVALHRLPARGHRSGPGRGGPLRRHLRPRACARGLPRPHPPGPGKPVPVRAGRVWQAPARRGARGDVPPEGDSYRHQERGAVLPRHRRHRHHRLHGHHAHPGRVRAGHRLGSSGPRTASPAMPSTSRWGWC
jgi:hypothetical protein